MFFIKNFKYYCLTFSLCLAIVCSYLFSFSCWLNTSPHDDQRLLQLIFLLLAAGFMLFNSLTQRTLPSALFNPNQIYIALFFGLGIVSSLMAFSTRMAFSEVVVFFTLLLSSYYIADEVSHSPQPTLNWILKLCGYSCVLYALKFFIVYISAFLVGVQPSTGNLFPNFSSYRFFNHTQTITLPLLALLYLNDISNGKKKYRWLLLSSFWWSLLFMLSARGTFVGIITGCTFACWFRKNQALSLCKTLLVSALVGIVLYALLFVFIPYSAGLESFGELFKLKDRLVISPENGRFKLWQMALKLISNNLTLGVGPMHFSHFSDHHMPAAHPHNWILQIGAEWGLPALTCLCIAIYMAMRSLIVTAVFVATDDYRNQIFLSAWVVIGVAILTDGLFSGLIVMPLSQCLLTLYLGCTMGWTQSLIKKSSQSSLPYVTNHALVTTYSLVMLAVISILVMILWTGIIKIENYDTEKYSNEVTNRNYPRLWVKGRF